MMEILEKFKTGILLKISLGFFVLPPFVAATFYTTHNAISAYWATQKLDVENDSYINELDPVSSLDLKRQIQQHYRKYNVYLPMDDIILDDIENKSKKFNPIEALTSHYGASYIYIFVPLKFSFPLFGDHYLDYIYIPK